VGPAPSQLTQCIRGSLPEMCSCPGACAGTTMREPVLLPRCRLQIGERRAQQARVVRTEAQRTVTTAAKQPAHAARDVAVIDAKDARHRAADRAGMALPFLQRAIVCQREPIAAGALRITIIGLERPPHAPTVVLQKACTLASAVLAGWLAGRLVLVGSWAMQSSLGPVPARGHQPEGRNNGSALGMEHQGDWRRVHRTQPKRQQTARDDDQAAAIRAAALGGRPLQHPFGGMRYSRLPRRNLSSAGAAMLRACAGVSLQQFQSGPSCRQLCISEDAANNITPNGTRPAGPWRKSCVA
jgi:hypothetical protein